MEHEHKRSKYQWVFDLLIVVSVLIYIFVLDWYKHGN